MDLVTTCLSRLVVPALLSTHSRANLRFRSLGFQLAAEIPVDPKGFVRSTVLLLLCRTRRLVGPTSDRRLVG